MKILSIGIGLVSAALLCGPAAAVETDYAAGTKALPLQQAGGTARAMAMGSAVVAVPQGSASLLWNPAGLSRLGCTEVGLHHNAGLGETIQETVIFGLPLGEVKDECKGGALGGIAASLGYVSYGSFRGMDANEVPTGDYQAGDFSGSLGWGIELLPGFSGGIVLKGNQSRFAFKSYNAFTTDLGVLYALFPNLDLGLTYSNVNLGSKIGGSGLASGLRLGAAWTLDKRLLLAASGELQNGDMDRVQLGAEYLVGDIEKKAGILALRGGYQVNFPNPQLDGMDGLSMGLGYTFSRSMALDYALVSAGELGSSHRLSLTVKFNCPEKAKDAAQAPAPVVRELVLKDSHFDFDKSELKPGGMRALRKNIQVLKDNPKATVRVAGFTSMQGTEEYNQQLSERRAIAVSRFLIAEGIAPERITAVGYGERRPETYESNPGKINSAAAKSNMRVLFTMSVK
ncbi:MAG: hypothetical protein A2X31_04500 [Elusimicrobia bacterium GWB2_63_22]|nr:MAG: hypothetical protein A2X31_04500 [Elusimicrobia bacterium GWB2_63_22]